MEVSSRGMTMKWMSQMKNNLPSYYSRVLRQDTAMHFPSSSSPGVENTKLRGLGRLQNASFTTCHFCSFYQHGHRRGGCWTKVISFTETVVCFTQRASCPLRPVSRKPRKNPGSNSKAKHITMRRVCSSRHSATVPGQTLGASSQRPETTISHP